MTAVSTTTSHADVGALGAGAALRAVGNEVYKGLLAGWSERTQILIEMPLFVVSALLIAAIARLQLEWRHFPEWPRAFGGFSGGAKRSASLAAMATVLGHPPIGVFQGGCNEPVMTRVLHRYPLDKARFRGIPVYLSGGRDDPIATRDQVEEVASNLRSSGFKQVRYERFNGGHELYPAHVEEALRWFVKLAVQPGPKL